MNAPFNKSYFKIFFAAFMLMSLYSCQYDKESFKDYAKAETNKISPILDTVKFALLNFDVYDSANNNLIGEEWWTFTGSNYYFNRKYYEYYVSRNYKYDSSGGRIYLSEPLDGKVYRLEFNKQWQSYFLDAKNPKYYPQDSLSFSREYIAPYGQILMRNYYGVTDINVSQSNFYCFRAGRDSTALPGMSYPYNKKIEDYYFHEYSGLTFMTEKYIKRYIDHDSTVYSIYKRRK